MAKPAIKQFIEAYAKGLEQGRVAGEARPGACSGRGRRDGSGDHAAARPGEPEVIGGDERHDAHHALVAILVIAVAAGLFARNRAAGLRGGGAPQQPAQLSRALRRPWAAFPALLFLAVWAPVQTAWSTRRCWLPVGQQLPDFDMARDTILTEARRSPQASARRASIPKSRARADLCQREARYAAIGGGIAIVIALLGGFFARAGSGRFPRTHRRRALDDGIAAHASLIAILTTLGIVLSLLFESLRFLQPGVAGEFLFGTT